MELSSENLGGVCSLLRVGSFAKMQRQACGLRRMFSYLFSMISFLIATLPLSCFYSSYCLTCFTYHCVFCALYLISWYPLLLWLFDTALKYKTCIIKCSLHVKTIPHTFLQWCSYKLLAKQILGPHFDGECVHDSEEKPSLSVLSVLALDESGMVSLCALKDSSIEFKSGE